MPFNSPIQSLQSRMPWRVASALFKHAGLITGQGWEKTASKNPDLTNTQRDVLIDALKNHILCGDKNLRVYNAAGRDLSTIKSCLEAALDQTSALTKAFPNVLSQDELGDIEKNRPEIVHIADRPEALYAVFASNTEISIKQTLDQTILADAMRDGNEELENVLRSSNEIVAFHIERRHAFDIVVAHKKSMKIEVRVDMFSSLSKPLRSVEIEEAHLRIVHKFTELCKQPYLRRQMNFHPAIQKLLLIGGEDEGVRVTRFGYVGPSGIARDERKVHGDVRSDPTHKAAISTTDKTDEAIVPYDIEIYYPTLTIPDQPPLILAIHGTETVGRSAVPVISELTIEKAIYEIEFSQLMDAVYHRTEVDGGA
jgi:hypothetical protein